MVRPSRSNSAIWWAMEETRACLGSHDVMFVKIGRVEEEFRRFETDQCCFVVNSVTEDTLHLSFSGRERGLSVRDFRPPWFQPG